MAGLDVESPAVQALIEKLVVEKVAITSTLAVLADLGTRTTRPTAEALASLSEEARTRYLQMKGYVSSGTNDDALKVEMAFQRAFVAA